MKEAIKAFFEYVDFFFNKVLPKKFMVFSVATILVFMGKITGEWWFYIAIAYFGVNILRVLADKGNRVG